MGTGGRYYDNDIRLEPHALSGESRKGLGQTVRRQIVDGESLPIDIAEVMQALEKPFKTR
jgi:hypothetical protein